MFTLDLHSSQELTWNGRHRHLGGGGEGQAQLHAKVWGGQEGRGKRTREGGGWANTRVKSGCS